MSSISKYKQPFIENEFYHVYNRTNNKEFLFKNDHDRNFFLAQFDHYSSPFMETHSYNLLLNHFHFLVRIKSVEMITAYLHSRPKSKMSSTEKNFLSQTISVHELIDNVFQRFLISYSMMYNKLHIRKGNLFHRPFKHVQIKDEAQFSQTVIYINANAVKHKLVTDLTTYKWSSYSSLLSTKETKLYRNEILDWFGGREQFIKQIMKQKQYYDICASGIQDD